MQKKMKNILIIGFLLISNFALTQNIDDKCFKAELALAEENYTEASLIFSELIQKNKSNKLIKKTAIANYNSGQYKQAITNFNFLFKREKTYASIFISKCYARLADFENAIKYLKIHLQANEKSTQAAIKLDPAFAEIKKTKKWDKLWLKDWYSEYENQIGDAIYNMNHERYIEALDILDGSILSNEKAHKAHYLRAKVYIAIDDYKRAFKDIKSALEIKSKEESYILLQAEISNKLKKHKLALENYNILLKNEKYNFNYYIKRAETYSNLENYKLAIEDIDICLKYDSNNSNLNYLKAKYQTNNGETWDALISLNQLIKTKPTAEYHLARGQLYLITNNNKSAFKDFSQALDYNPKIGEAYYQLSLLSLNDKNKQNACYYLKTAIKLGIYEANEVYDKNCRE